jgi:hypothetical protein
MVSLDLLKEAFCENELLREYCALPEKSRLDPEFINMYVLEALMAVIRRAHRSPGCQNIRPNPRRADQVQVLVKEGGERWEILTLVEAVRLLFRDAASRMEQLAGTVGAALKLSAAEQIASLLMPQEYRRRPEKYEREGKSRLAAHLATLADGRTAGAHRPQGRAKGPAAGTASPNLAPHPADGELKKSASEIDPAALDALLDDLADFASDAPEAGSPPYTPTTPAGAGPRPSASSGPRLFTPAAAAALLREHPPQLDVEDRAPPSALRQLEKLSGQDATQIVSHLWDAKEDGLLSPAEQVWAAALTRLYDGVD